VYELQPSPEVAPAGDAGQKLERKERARKELELFETSRATYNQEQMAGDEIESFGSIPSSSF
jgi:cell fate (sporulation/competence/biofilm development) regulator YlbF (YheA/YmcA/DUF963 family)